MDRLVGLIRKCLLWRRQYYMYCLTGACNLLARPICITSRNLDLWFSFDYDVWIIARLPNNHTVVCEAKACGVFRRGEPPLPWVSQSFLIGLCIRSPLDFPLAVGAVGARKGDPSAHMEYGICTVASGLEASIDDDVFLDWYRYFVYKLACDRWSTMISARWVGMVINGMVNNGIMN